MTFDTKKKPPTTEGHFFNLTVTTMKGNLNPEEWHMRAAMLHFVAAVIYLLAIVLKVVSAFYHLG